MEKETQDKLSRIVSLTEIKDYDGPSSRLWSHTRTMHGLMTIITEAGELLDAYKKHVYYGKPLDNTNVMEEIGDIYYGLEIIHQSTQISVDECIDALHYKLMTRYPDGFSEDMALSRNLDEERRALERGGEKRSSTAAVSEADKTDPEAGSGGVVPPP